MSKYLVFGTEATIGVSYSARENSDISNNKGTSLGNLGPNSDISAFSPNTSIVANVVIFIRPSQEFIPLSVHRRLQHVVRDTDHRAVHLRQLRLVNEHVYAMYISGRGSY